jgi:inosine-uridine nucleoside N-ribohydrolase
MADPMLIDCDPGIDHAVTLYYSARHFDVVQVTTTHGNAPLPITTHNALRLLAFAGLDVPVAAGCEQALLEARHSAELFHGDDGLAGADLPEPVRPAEDRHAVEAIIETARAHRGALVVACLGPMTNLAIALRLEPRLPEWIRVVTLMGGADRFGHMTPTTEFNFWCDPEAANIVCSSRLNTRIIGYDITRRTGFTTLDIGRMANAGLPIASLIAKVFGFNLERQRAIWGLEHAPIHSTLAVVPLVRPDLARSTRRPMSVELQGRYTRGMSVYDDRPLDRLTTPPFERLPAAEIECTTWIDPTSVAHVIETILSYR